MFAHPQSFTLTLFMFFDCIDPVDLFILSSHVSLLWSTALENVRTYQYTKGRVFSCMSAM